MTAPADAAHRSTRRGDRHEGGGHQSNGHGGVRPRVGVGAAVVLLLVGLGCAVLFSALAPKGQSAVVPADAEPQPRPAASASAVASGAVIFVHILGAVARPGLYELREGARGVDAVAAAGGFAPDADQAGLNLARFLSDGEQIVVPVTGAAPPPGNPVAGAGGAVVPGKVNLNTADAAALETLPRVGPAMAERIIAWRTENGRFTAVEDLLSVTGIGEKTFEGLKELVTV
jgi:competence protein ComEA